MRSLQVSGLLAISVIFAFGFHDVNNDSVISSLSCDSLQENTSDDSHNPTGDRVAKYRLKAEEGDSEAQHILSMFYMTGHCCPKTVRNCLSGFLNPV